MKIKKQLALIICFLTVSANLATIAHAANSSVSIPVQYNVSKDSKYKTSVEVKGPGTVYDGTAKITNGTIVYELNVEQQKTFKLIPNKNAKVKSVIWNDKDITGALMKINEGYTLNIAGISSDSKLIIEFVKENYSNIPNDTNNNGNNSNGSPSNKLPNTGYKGNIKLALLISILGFMAIIIGSRKEFNKR